MSIEQEQVAAVDLFRGIYAGKRVLITGHTGFKGSWLALWLRRLGAEVCGFSLPPPTEPSHWEALGGAEGMGMRHIIGNICDQEALNHAFAEFRPQVVFHLAAQPIVRDSYRVPVETYETNVIGSLRVLESCRKQGGVEAVVCITTDKVYRNEEWVWGYRETDPFGGYDPYSASKACCEIAVGSYRDSFFPIAQYGKTHRTLVCTARAGNVVGGGDWAADRLIPDLVRGAHQKAPALIRNPDSTRPWQHVLEPLSGYLLLGKKLLEGQFSTAEGWNLGPNDDGVATVRQVVAAMQENWTEMAADFRPDPNAPHEARLLKLDISKARDQLGWRPVWNAHTTFKIVARWYQKYYAKGSVDSHTDLEEFVRATRAIQGKEHF